LVNISIRQTEPRLYKVEKYKEPFDTNYPNGELNLINSKFKNLSIQYIDLKDILTPIESPLASTGNKKILEIIKHIKRLSTESKKYNIGSNVILFQDEKELQIENRILTYSEIKIDELLLSNH